MSSMEPVAELDARYSSEGVAAQDWAHVVRRMEAAEVFWLSTVRPGGRPHVTPLLCVWVDSALYFCTGPGERKAQNLLANAQCVLTAGRDRLDDGLDVVVEGEAVKVGDYSEFRSVADAYDAKYGQYFTAPEPTWAGLADSIRAGDALVFRVAPSTVFGFDKGKQFSQTRWRFGPTDAESGSPVGQ
jgi:nitroimidazol reductase NimA-like FMN-containing flavoprotein (pyridoxamine 5'-phosphate oxidase superfamily)